MRRREEADWPHLVPVFPAAFSDLPPFTVTDADVRLRAAEACLEHTRAGRDGEIITSACFIAGDPARGREVEGAALVTLIDRDPLVSRGGDGALDDDAGSDRNPHLTWIFVSPLAQRRGLAAAMLSAVVEALRRQGQDRLASTMLVGNCRSILWHWRCGFRPLGVL